MPGIPGRISTRIRGLNRRPPAKSRSVQVTAEPAARSPTSSASLQLRPVLWAEFPIDFVAALALGIVFQYFTIKPMRNLSVGEGIVAAIKADTLSILAFQVGMYAWMTLVYFVLFPDPHLTPFNPCYWWMMQIGMVCGFATSFPMNRFLLRAGLKEAM
jgi:hypothetical protein